MPVWNGKALPWWFTTSAAQTAPLSTSSASTAQRRCARATTCVLEARRSRCEDCRRPRHACFRPRLSPAARRTGRRPNPARPLRPDHLPLRSKAGLRPTPRAPLHHMHRAVRLQRVQLRTSRHPALPALLQGLRRPDIPPRIQETHLLRQGHPGIRRPAPPAIPHLRRATRRKPHPRLRRRWSRRRSSRRASPPSC